VRLREALLAATYRAAGQTYRPDWAFHQKARAMAIGAPLSGSYRIAVEGSSYALQVYALDTLYNLVPQWSDVRRMSNLAASQQPLGAPMAAPAAVERVVLGEAAVPMAVERVVLGEAEAAPSGLELRLVRYTPQSQACGDRSGRAIEQVILHALPGPVETSLHAMTAMGARFATHYYLSLDGLIYQLVDEALAAWHAGIASADGFWLNLNLTSIGVALERPADWPEGRVGDTEPQLLALRWLLQQLARRYPLSPSTLLLWSSLAGSDADAAEGLPLSVLREALAGVEKDRYVD
jgi:hypothetical protein